MYQFVAELLHSNLYIMNVAS